MRNASIWVKLPAFGIGTAISVLAAYTFIYLPSCSDEKSGLVGPKEWVAFQQNHHGGLHRKMMQWKGNMMCGMEI
jgi:hypothetical protein